METKVIKVNPRRPERDKIKQAAKIIKSGGLVAFPTETVYGLGADAFDSRAVLKIFKAKDRPADDPLIVHIASMDDLPKIAKNISPMAESLAKKFWPGPLTLVLKRGEFVPKKVTAGSDTVAVRMPDNEIARRLIEAAGVPLAAPSANLFGRPSPTRAKHVARDLGGRIGMVLDGGPAKIGVESTVLDLTVSPPVILRPGGVTREKLKKFLPDVKSFPSVSRRSSPSKSPGMRYRHYAPRAKLVLIEGEIGPLVREAQRLIGQFHGQGKLVGVLASKETVKSYRAADALSKVGSRKNISTVARNLFKMIREMDRGEVDVILTEGFAEQGLGAAVMNRLRRAAARIVKAE